MPLANCGVGNPFVDGEAAFNVERVVEGLPRSLLFPSVAPPRSARPPSPPLPVINSIRCCIMTLQGRPFHYLLRSFDLCPYYCWRTPNLKWPPSMLIYVTAALERSPFKPKLTRRFVTVIRRNAERRLPRFAAEADATAGSSEDDLEVGSRRRPIARYPRPLIVSRGSIFATTPMLLLGRLVN